MNSEDLSRMLTDVSDKYIQEAAPKKKKQSFSKKLLIYSSIAACLCLILLGSMYINAYARPASYISIDVNPSIEICLNKWNRVIDVIPYNDDAERICRQLNLKNKYYTDAIEELLCNKDFQAYYLNQNTSDLTFTIVSQYCDELQSGIESCKSYSEASGIIHHANMDTANLAHENNCSIGKYAAYEELHEYDNSITLNDCINMTMHELHNEIDSHHNDSHNEKHEEHHGGTH